MVRFGSLATLGLVCVCVCVLCSRVFKYVHQPFTCGYYCMLADRSCLFVCFRLISKAIIIELWEQRAQNIYSIRCKHNSPANMCSIPFKWTFFLNRKLFIFTFSFLSLLNCNTSWFFWLGTLWTCLAACLLMVSHKVSLCYEIHTINFSLQVVTCILINILWMSARELCFSQM